MLDRVTITGADDNIKPYQLVDLSLEFPFVEWGILISKSREGTPRYPSRGWLDQMLLACAIWDQKMKYSVHVCGAWSRDIFEGVPHWDEMPDITQYVPRIQINGTGHADTCVEATQILDMRSEKGPVQWIFQSPRNDYFAYFAASQKLDVAYLMDDSGGRGIERSDWPRPHRAYTGYAGGLGPDNVVQAVSMVEAFATKPFWIDMEGRVRDENDRLDLGKVRRVLELCAPLLVSAPPLVSSIPR